MVLSCSVTNGQQEAKPFVESASKSYVQPPTVGIYFTFNDFETADAIRNSSLAAVIRDKKYGKLQNMSQGLAVSYGKGLSANYDFVGTLGGAFLSYPVPNTDASANEGLLLEGDASIRGKMFSDKSWFVPYLQAGVGISKYQGYWGTFVPVGLGIQISFFGEAYLHINTQYRLAISETSNYHFVHSIGLVGNIGKRG